MCACLAAHTRVICSHEFSNSIWFYFSWMWVMFNIVLFREDAVVVFYYCGVYLTIFLHTHNHIHMDNVDVAAAVCQERRWWWWWWLYMDVVFMCVWMYVYLWLPMRVYVTCAYMKKKIVSMSFSQPKRLKLKEENVLSFGL